MTATPRRSRRWPVGVLLALGITAMMACYDGEDDREDTYQFRTSVVWCEEALARLVDCCPGFDGSRLECQYFYAFDDKGCGSSTERKILPVFSTAESRCVRDTSCDALVENGVCARAQNARAPSSDVTIDPSSQESSSSKVVPPTPPVCP